MWKNQIEEYNLVASQKDIVKDTAEDIITINGILSSANPSNHYKVTTS
jgi:hypothetical protein